MTIQVAPITDEELARLERLYAEAREERQEEEESGEDNSTIARCLFHDEAEERLPSLLARLRAAEAELREAKMMVDVWRASNAAMLATQVPRMIEQVCCCGGHRCGRGLP